MRILGDDKKSLQDIELVTFSELKMEEKNIEEILIENIDLLDDDNDDDENTESMIVVGRQVRNEGNGRCDLTAIDKFGNLVLIEIKRDARDIKSRAEEFTFQAIRYVASFSKIQTVADLADKVYVPYLEKKIKPSVPVDDNLRDIAIKKLNQFLGLHKLSDLSGKQRIVLVAGDYDSQTLSAAAWLINNGVDISCFRIAPYRWEEKILLDVKQLLPLKDYIVGIAEPGSRMSSVSKSATKEIHRTRLPKINALIREGILFVGDLFTAKDRPGEEVELLANSQIKVVSTSLTSLKVGETTSLQQWLRKVYDWDAVDTYHFTVVKSSKNVENNGKLIYEIRQAWMDSIEVESSLD